MIQKTLNRPFLDWFDEGIWGFAKGNQQHSQSVLFAVIAWNLWKWRNERIFNGKVIDAKRKSYRVSMNRQLKFTKLWFAKCGGLARDEQGNWLKGFTYGIGDCPAETVEAWALLQGIQMAKLFVSNKTCFESHSKTTVDAITQLSNIGNLADNILRACRQELEGIEEWHISLIARDQNFAADFLAKSPGAEKGVTLLDHPIEGMLHILEYDRFGIPVWRQRIC
ncbi:uncharacterized protein LOC115999395 [Ipomoea triloba]|uniref:uncharacterized protein LOC115999395 n=1 Tax=Ipomoea triloba TaxID=35885 RepID=UPI00125D9276|nr:uncharacterized protein LOC115999395 [Ipomoea triloba]